MNQTAGLKRILAAPLPGATLYLGLMILLLFVVFSSLAEILSRRADVAASGAMLEQFEGRRPAAVRGQGTSVAPVGSHFCRAKRSLSPVPTCCSA